jgi:hypothetical protein
MIDQIRTSGSKDKDGDIGVGNLLVSPVRRNETSALIASFLLCLLSWTLKSLFLKSYPSQYNSGYSKVAWP